MKPTSARQNLLRRHPLDILGRRQHDDVYG